MIRSRGTRLGQPSGPVEIDWGNPITAGIQFAHTPATITGSTLVSGDYFGESYVGTGATVTNQALVMPTPPVYLGTLANSTILAVGSTNAILGSATGQIGAGGDAMIAERGSTGNDIYKIGLTSVSSVLNAEFVYRNDGNTLLQLRASCAGLNDGRPLVVSAVKTGTNHRIGINGITNTGTFGSASTAFTDATLIRQIGCDRADGTSGWNGFIDFVAGWERSLSVEEIRSLEANPWQIYRPRERRIWVPVAGGGGISQTVAFTLEDVSASVSQTLSHAQSLNGTLDDVTVSISQTAQHDQALSATLDDIEFDAVQIGALPAVGGMGFVFTDTPSALWWKRKPKALSDEVAEQKVERVVRVIKEIAGKQQPEQTAKQAQREVAQAIAPMLADMPGFDWTPLYRTIVAEFQRQREEAARIEAVAQIARIRAIEQDDEDILLLMI